jgi:hypothetical protein
MEKKNEVIYCWKENEIPHGRMDGAEKKEKGKGKTHHHNKKENQQKPKTFSFLMEIFEALFIFSISGAFWFKFNGNFGFPSLISFFHFHPFHHGSPSSSTQFISPSRWLSLSFPQSNSDQLLKEKLLHQSEMITALNNKKSITLPSNQSSFGEVWMCCCWTPVALFLDGVDIEGLLIQKTLWDNSLLGDLVDSLKFESLLRFLLLS